LHAAILAVLHRMLRGRRPYLLSILKATKNPARLGLLLLALAITLPTTPLEPETKAVLARCLLLATFFLLGWIATAALEIAATIYLRKFRLDVEDNLLARKHVTQIRVLVRVLDTVIILITLGFALMTFDAVRQYGVSLFASAGVAGIIAGLAARPVLSNLFAGVQLAVTQPIRIEDAVTVENEYGWVEEITSTYVVIRLWDLRRLIVPLTYFIEKPFYNWTRHAANYIGNVLLYLDYGAPIDRIRRKATELVAQSKLASGKVTNVQVTNARPESIEVRILISADSAANAANLCAELREELISFLLREHPEALPRLRSEAIAVARKESPPPTPGSHGN
jgi:small-conductance mechanosensitive channel